MHYKRIIGIVLFLAGIALVSISFYIKNQVSEGKIKISRGEKKLEQGKKLFSWNPATEEVGKVITKPAERKIAKGKRDVSYYEELSNWLMISGIVCVVGGVGVVLFGRKK